jgi:single-strand DNA-binding protein
MSSLNVVHLIGHLTRDVDLKYTPKGTAVGEFGMAVNRVYKVNEEKKEEVCFLDCVAWSGAAEVASKYLKKGSQVFISGYLKQDNWTEKETGKKRSKLRVIVENLVLLGTKGGGESRRDESEAPPRQHKQQEARKAPEKDPDLDVDESDDDSDIPF